MNCILFLIRVIATKAPVNAYVSRDTAKLVLAQLGGAYEIVDINLVDASLL